MDTDVVGDKIGRIHLGRQDLDELQTRKMKGLKRSRDAVVEDDIHSDEKAGEEAPDLMQEDGNNSISNDKKTLQYPKRHRLE